MITHTRTPSVSRRVASHCTTTSSSAKAFAAAHKRASTMPLKLNPMEGLTCTLHPMCTATRYSTNPGSPMHAANTAPHPASEALGLTTLMPRTSTNAAQLSRLNTLLNCKATSNHRTDAWAPPIATDCSFNGTGSSNAPTSFNTARNPDMPKVTSNTTAISDHSNPRGVINFVINLLAITRPHHQIPRAQHPTTLAHQHAPNPTTPTYPSTHPAKATPHKEPKYRSGP